MARSLWPSASSHTLSKSFTSSPTRIPSKSVSHFSPALYTMPERLRLSPSIGSRGCHREHRTERGLHPYRLTRHRPTPSRRCLSSSTCQSINRPPHHWCKTYFFFRRNRNLTFLVSRSSFPLPRLVTLPSATSSPSPNVSQTNS
jgi:hypothetical protein